MTDEPQNTNVDFTCVECGKKRPWTSEYVASIKEVDGKVKQIRNLCSDCWHRLYSSNPSVQ